MSILKKIIVVKILLIIFPLSLIAAEIDEFTKLLIQSSNPNNSTNFTDSSQNNHSISAQGNTSHSTAEKKFGDSSIYFDGASDYLSVTQNLEDFRFDGDFTIDFWINTTSAATEDKLVLDGYTLPATGWYVDIRDNGNSIMLFSEGSNNVLLDLSGSFRDGQWHHIAFVREGSTMYGFYDGQLKTTLISNFTVINMTCSQLEIGGTSKYVGNDMNGYLDEIRISKGKARWTDNFSLRSKPYGSSNYMLKVEDIKGAINTSISVPIKLTNLDSQGIEGIDFTVEYDKNVLTPKSMTLQDGILENNYTYNIGINDSGMITACVAATSEPFVISSGIIAYIIFDVISENNSLLSLTKTNINEILPDNYNGSFTIDKCPELETNSSISNKNYELQLNTSISVPFKITDIDTPVSNLIVSGISSNQTVVPNSNIIFVNNGNNYTLTINPAQDQYSEEPFTVTINISDGTSEISSQITLTVINGYMLAGSVNYYSGTNNPIAGVEILISGEYEYSATTDENGLYTISNVTAGDYTITGSFDNLNGVSADDATRIRRYKVLDNVTFNCYQKIAADVSRDGTISALDSSRVAIGSAKIEAGQQVCFQNDSCINWIFTKPIDDCNTSSTIEINNQITINSNINDLDINGIRIGDVTGDWIANSPIGGNDSNTVLLIHSDNNEGDTTFNDSSGSMHSIAPTGNVQHKQIDKVFGKSSIYFDGDGDYLTIQNHQDFTFGSDNFTIDAWIKMETGTTLWQTIFAKSSGNYQGIIFDVNPDGRIEFVAGNGSWSTSIHTSTGVAPVDQWIHLAVVREGTGTNQVKIYLNGQIAAQGTYSGNYGDSSTNVTIGAYTWSTNRNKGFLDEIRISKGIARTLDPDDPMYDPESDGFVLSESIYSN